MLNRHILFVSATILGVALAGCSRSSGQPAASAPSTATETATQDADSRPIHAIVGEAQEVAPDGSYLVVAGEGGKTHTIHTTGKTEVRTLEHGLDVAGDSAANAVKTSVTEVKKGAMVAVRFTEKEGKLVAHEIHHASKEVVKKSEVVIDRVEEGGSKIIARTKNGAEEAYDVGEHATVVTGHEIADIGKATGGKIATGGKATVHFTEQAGQKIAHFISQ